MGYFVGEFSQKLEKIKGKLCYDNGDWYEGGFKNDMYEGEGILSKNKEIFSGIFMKNSLNGKGGKHILANNDFYDGDFINNKYEGFGKYNFSNGGYIEGQFKDGFAEGKCIQYISHQGKYEGKFEKGILNGQGQFRSINNDYSYEGEFVNGIFEGKGKEIYNNVDCFEGSYKSGNKYGKFFNYNLTMPSIPARILHY